MSFDITIYKMPAYDKQWINIIHLTTKGNEDSENIFKLSMYRNGLVGKFSFNYWRKEKAVFFSLGTTYHVVIEQFKTSRGRSYSFMITVDGVDLVHKHLKDIKQGLTQTYHHVKIFGSNPWQPTMPSKVGVVKNFKLDTGRKQRCCNIVVVRIDESYLSISHAGAQKSLVGEYTYKGIKNGHGYWIKNDGKQAIWYLPAYREWCVGSILTLGTNWRGISAGQTSAKCPTQNKRRWQYFNEVSWKTDLKHHIHIRCKQNYLDYHKDSSLSTGK